MKKKTVEKKVVIAVTLKIHIIIQQTVIPIHHEIKMTFLIYSTISEWLFEVLGKKY